MHAAPLRFADRRPRRSVRSRGPLPCSARWTFSLRSLLSSRAAARAQVMLLSDSTYTA